MNYNFNKMIYLNNILIVDDDDITNFITKSHLGKLGFKNFKSVSNGREAIEYITTNQDPDIILLDLNMPVMDGWEFLEERKRLNLCPNAKIYLVTSSGRTEDKMKAAQYDNVKDYVEKPLNCDQLSQTFIKINSCLED